MLAIALALALAAPANAPANWNQPFAGSLNVDATKDGVIPRVANVDGVPYVAWRESSGAHDQIRVKQFSGGAWTAVGASLNIDTTKDADHPSITSIGGVPYVVWSESDAAAHTLIHVRRFTGGAWNAVGPALNTDTTKNANHPSIAGIGGVPFVAWEESNGTVTQIRVRQFNGATWTDVGTPLNVDLTKDAARPSIASIGGVPYVAWEESNGAVTQIRAKLFNGAAWTGVATPLNVDATKVASSPTIADVGGVPFVAWHESNGTHTLIDVKQFSGGAWTAVDGALNVDATKDAANARIANIGGVPFVAWEEFSGTADQIHVKHFVGGAWTAVSGALNVDATKSADSSSITSIGGVPYVTWFELDGARLQTRVKRLEPDILSESATPTTTGATLATQVNDFGVPLPIGFELGQTAAFGTQTALQTTPGGGVSTLTQAVGGLAPATAYAYRAFGSDTFRQTSLGSTQSFTTLAQPAVVRPAVTNLRQSASRWREGGALAKISRKRRPPVGTTFSFRLNKAATVRLAFTQRVAGRRVKGKCVAQTKRNRKKPRCTRTVTVGTLSFRGRAGTNKVRFQGRLSRRKRLKPGRYTLTVTARDSTGLQSAPRSVSFTIVKG